MQHNSITRSNPSQPSWCHRIWCKIELGFWHLMATQKQKSNCNGRSLLHVCPWTFTHSPTTVPLIDSTVGCGWVEDPIGSAVLRVNKVLWMRISQEIPEAKQLGRSEQAGFEIRHTISSLTMIQCEQQMLKSEPRTLSNSLSVTIFHSTC